MSRYDYLVNSEVYGSTQWGREDDIVVNYPCSSPRIIVKESDIKAPYINTDTGTWWQYNSETHQYNDTHVSANISDDDITTIINRILPNINISMLNNDAQYATSDEDQPLTLEEVREILQ